MEVLHQGDVHTAVDQPPEHDQRSGQAVERRQGGAVFTACPEFGVDPVGQQARLLAQDPHPLAKFRAKGTLSNMPQFAGAFQCKVGDAMVRPEKDRCQIW